MTRDLVLFCGAGGASAGLVRAGWNPVSCVDSWSKACIAHRRWHPELPVVRARIEKAHMLLNSDFRFVWASPSCKPWSVANRTPKRGRAHPEYYSLAYLVWQTFSPWRARWLVIENVSGLVWSREGRREIDELRSEVARFGLKLSIPRGGTIASNTLGIAQLRRRVFLVIGPVYVAIRPGGEWIPPAGVPELLWEASARVNRGIVDASSPSRHSNWTRASTHQRTQPVVMACERSWNLSKTRDGHKKERNGMGRTLAACAALQVVPLEILEGFSKNDACRLVGNAVPWPVAKHIGEIIVRADKEDAVLPVSR